MSTIQDRLYAHRIRCDRRATLDFKERLVRFSLAMPHQVARTLAFMAAALYLMLFATSADAMERKYCYTIPVTADGQVTYFETHQTRCDIIITGKDVTIASPLRTNGGDVVIIADKLFLDAPIDTRPYFRTTRTFFDASIDPVPNRYPNWEDTPDSIPAVLKSYTELYYWQEYYDAQAKTFKYGVRLPQFSLHSDALSSPYEAPELPR